MDSLSGAEFELETIVNQLRTPTSLDVISDAARKTILL